MRAPYELGIVRRRVSRCEPRASGGGAGSPPNPDSTLRVWGGLFAFAGAGPWGWGQDAAVEPASPASRRRRAATASRPRRTSRRCNFHW